MQLDKKKGPLDKIKRTVVITMAAVAFIATLIKLFTSIITLPDDASILLVIRFPPSFDNFIVTSDLSGMIVLILDENELLGRSFYELITDYIWWISLSIVVLNSLFQKIKINSKSV